jgi:TolB-like protein/DNA-binding winged helix-turn-helix (wHTH) protein
MSDSNNSTANHYRFDGFTVDCRNFRISKDGHDRTLTPRAFDVLIFLLHNNGRLVEKQELFDGVWKESFVSDNALTKVIKEIRSTLEDPVSDPRYIETVPKRGYRFIAAVEESPDSATQNLGEVPSFPRYAISRRALAAAIVGVIAVAAVGSWYLLSKGPVQFSPRRSIAVLPFRPLDQNSRDESLELGMAEALITRLSNLREVAVRPMSSVRKFVDPNMDPADVGRQLQTDSVLDGSIQKAGERIRVTVRLIDVATGNPLWSKEFDESVTDIFQVQTSIAQRVAGAFALELNKNEKEQLTKRYTKDAEAYELYLQAKVIWHGRRANWLAQSMDLYQRALAKDPDFAMAYIGLVDCYQTLVAGRRMKPEDAAAKIRPAIMRALEIDPTLAQAHNALAEVKYQGDYDWPGAEKEFQTAISLNPNVAIIHMAYGWFMMSQGRFDEAKVEVETARSLDPSSLTLSLVRGKFLYYSRDYDLALQQFQNLLSLEPNDAGAHFFVFAIYEQKHMYAEGIDSLLKFMALTGQQEPQKIEELRQVFITSGRQAFFEKLLEILRVQAQTRPIEAYRLAGVNIRLGNNDEAFALLETAWDDRDPSMIQFKVDPANDGLRSDPRYAPFVRRIGLEP